MSVLFLSRLAEEWRASFDLTLETHTQNLCSDKRKQTAPFFPLSLHFSAEIQNNWPRSTDNIGNAGGGNGDHVKGLFGTRVI